MDAGYWNMPKVDVFLIDTKSKDASKTTDVTLEISEGDAPYAPMGFSYSCSKQLVYRNGSTVLTLENIQVSLIHILRINLSTHVMEIAGRYFLYFWGKIIGKSRKLF